MHCSELERTRPIGRFISVRDSDNGVGLSHSFIGKGRLHDLPLIRGPDSPGLFVSPKPGRVVLDLEDVPYTSFPLEFKSERDLRIVSAAQLFEYVPKSELGRCGGFELVLVSLPGFYRSVSAEMRLYERLSS